MREHLDRLFHHVAEGRGLQFSIEFDPQLGNTIHTDSKRLEQVVRNLLGNAFKFTQKGQVRLRVSPAKSGWSPDHPVLSKAKEVVAFSIIDTGIGIPEDKQKIIFEAFQQAESGTSRKYGGTGLGLSISRELAILLGGQLTLAKSQPGQGSTFILYLPKDYVSGQAVTSLPLPASYPNELEASRTLVHTMPPENSEKPTPAEIGEKIQQVLRPDESILKSSEISSKKARHNNDILIGRKVLVVDDDIRNIFAMTSLLEHEQMKVVTAESGREALEVLAKTPDVDIVLMDIMMPEMDGYDTMRAIRLKEDLKPLPIIALTAKAMKGDREKCIESGATDYITKPVDTEQLLILMGTRLIR
jgi:CheY-like chemotaxis protein